jgi:hypothetical protein
VNISVSFHESGEPHPADGKAPNHIRWVMGVYDPHGMRLNHLPAVACYGDGPVDLDEAARANAAYWPGNQVHLWLGTSLTPTEHLRDMPPADGSSVGGVR